MRRKGRVRQDATVRNALIVVRVGETGHAEVKFLPNAHSAEVRGDLEPWFERADTMSCHGVEAQEGVHGGRYRGARVLEESIISAIVFRV